LVIYCFLFAFGVYIVPWFSLTTLVPKRVGIITQMRDARMPMAGS